MNTKKIIKIEPQMALMTLIEKEKRGEYFVWQEREGQYNMGQVRSQRVTSGQLLYGF
jgi:hypothetical protein